MSILYYLWILSASMKKKSSCLYDMYYSFIRSVAEDGYAVN